MRSRAIALMMLVLAASLVTTRTVISQQVNQPDVVFKFDKRTEGRKLLEDVSQTIIAQTKLEAVSFLRNGETFVRGDVFVVRAVELGVNLGQHDAEYLLENQHLIPTKLRGIYLVFPGTKWRYPHGYVYVACLYWSGDRWYLDFIWLGRDFDSNDRLVRPRK